jgi:hypothetical protein
MEYQNETNGSRSDDYGSDNTSDLSFASEHENDLLNPVGRKSFETAMRAEDLTPKLRAYLEHAQKINIQLNKAALGAVKEATNAGGTGQY